MQAQLVNSPDLLAISQSSNTEQVMSPNAFPSIQQHDTSHGKQFGAATVGQSG